MAKLVKSFKGDFLGFTLGGLHSSEFGIVRVVGGNRTDLPILPTIKNNSIQIPGLVGSYYMDTDIQSEKESIRIAYDDISETEIREMRAWLGKDGVQDFIFDEYPYKVYKVKITGQPKLNFVCFDNEDETARVYKGEGIFQFDFFQPYARALHKELTAYPVEQYPNRHEWSESSYLKISLSDAPGYDNFVGNICNLYNAGDMDSPLIIPVIEVKDRTGYQIITYRINGEEKGKMVLDMSKLPTQEFIRLDSSTQLLLGLNKITLKPSGFIYNNAIVAGDFFKVKASKEDVQDIIISPSVNQKISFRQINGFDVDYDYLYY